MRVALIDPSLFTVPYDRELASGLMRTGHQVTLYGRPRRPLDETLGPVHLEPLFYRAAESRVGLSLPSPARLALKGADHGWSMWRLLQRLRRDPPDVIHFQWLPLPLLDSGLLRQFKRVAPVVLTVHDTNPFNGAPSAAIQRRGIHRCLHDVDRLVVHTGQGCARLQRLGVPQSRIDIVPHGMLIDAIPGAPDPMEGPLTFLLFGKIRPYKGADILIEAFAALPDESRMQSCLRIVGKPYMDIAPLRAAADRLGVSVRWGTDFVPDSAIAGLFGPGTVVMFPYREIEASGVLFLAIAHARPIIASRLGAFAELLTDREHGHIVSPEDLGALTAAMQHIVADRGFAAGAAAAVRKLADEIPGWDEIARRTVYTYQKAAASVAEHPVPSG